MKHLSLLATVAIITVKMSFTHFHSISCQETYSFIKIMQLIGPNRNLENRVKQIKITKENLSQSCILCQLLTCIKQSYLFLPLFALYLLSGCDLFNMSCLS